MSRLQCFAYQQDGQWAEDGSIVEALEWFNRRAAGEPEAGSDGRAGGGDTVDEKATRDILYGMEKLRKRPGAED